MRSYNFEQIENFRDLGGYECSYGTAQFGVIYRSATLAYATENDIKKIEDLEIKSVIDLREDEVKEKLPNPFKNSAKISYVSLKVNGNGRIPTSHNDGIESYFEMLEDPYSARKILKAIVTSPKPLVIHCNAGKDRTGVFSFLLLLLNGVSFNDINADYMLSFPYLFNMTIDTRKNRPEVPEFLLTPNIFYLREFYDEFLNRYGTAEEYCESIGLNDEEINTLCNIFGKKDLSIGGVIINDEFKILIEHMAGGHYALPKGHREENDESEKESLKREVFEETGIHIHVLDIFMKSVYFSPEKGILKEVKYFVGQSNQRPTKIQKEEVQDAFYLNIEDAIRTLSYQSDKDLLIEAYKAYLNYVS